MRVLLATSSDSARIDSEYLICILKYGLDVNIVELVKEMGRSGRIKIRENGDKDSLSTFINVGRFCSMCFQIISLAGDEHASKIQELKEVAIFLLVSNM